MLADIVNELFLMKMKVYCDIIHKKLWDFPWVDYLSTPTSVNDLHYFIVILLYYFDFISL